MGAELLECRDCLCLASRAAARTITRVYDRHLRPHGLRITQFSILTNLALRGGLSVNGLAKTLGMDRTTLSRNVGLLSEKGWVRARSDTDDARSTILELTAAGRAIIDAALPAWRKAQLSVSADFGTSGVAALKRLATTELS